MQSVVGKRTEKFMTEAGFSISGGGEGEGEDGGALYLAGRHIGFVYFEDNDAWKYYPSEKGGGLFPEDLEQLGELLKVLQESSESKARRELSCKKRQHTWESGSRSLYICVDCGEPGFWVPNVIEGKDVLTRAEAKLLMADQDVDELRRTGYK